MMGLHGPEVRSMGLRRARVVLGIIPTVAFAACSESTASLVCDPGAPGPSLAVAQQDSLAPVPINRRTIDDIWADIARQVPGGWGGFFLENGQPTVFLVQPSRQDEALAALYEAGVGEPFDVREADVRRGRWDFAQLHDWRRYIDQVVGRPDGVISSDLDEVRNRIAYGVRDSEADVAFSSRLEGVNVPCELVLIEVRGGISTRLTPSPPHTPDDGRSPLFVYAHGLDGVSDSRALRPGPTPSNDFVPARRSKARPSVSDWRIS